MDEQPKTVELGTSRIQVLTESLLLAIMQECVDRTRAPGVKVGLDFNIAVPSEYKEKLHEWYPMLAGYIINAHNKMNNIKVQLQPDGAMVVDNPNIKREP